MTTNTNFINACYYVQGKCVGIGGGSAVYETCEARRTADVQPGNPCDTCLKARVLKEKGILPYETDLTAFINPKS